MLLVPSYARHRPLPPSSSGAADSAAASGAVTGQASAAGKRDGAASGGGLPPKQGRTRTPVLALMGCALVAMVIAPRLVEQMGAGKRDAPAKAGATPNESRGLRAGWRAAPVRASGVSMADAATLVSTAAPKATTEPRRDVPARGEAAAPSSVADVIAAYAPSLPRQELERVANLRLGTVPAARACPASPTGAAPAAAVQPRALRHTAMASSASSTKDDWPSKCAEVSADRELCATLRAAAVNREVMVAVANGAVTEQVRKLAESARSAGVTNFVVVAIDKRMHSWAKSEGLHSYYTPSDARGSHKISAAKFGILKRFLEYGCSVLLTDTDIVYVRNPFDHLYRDSDVEGMSDGWDDASAYGFVDELIDPIRGNDTNAQPHFTMRMAALNSGLWYLRATAASVRMLAVMQHRMETEDTWDQSGYNQELFLPGKHDTPHSGCTVRVMRSECFVNSKVFFRVLTRGDLLQRMGGPVAVHANYHQDKEARMNKINAFYHNGRTNELLGVLQSSRHPSDGVAVDSISKLEAGVLGGLHDGFLGGRNQVVSLKFAREAGTAPLAPRTPAWTEPDTSALRPAGAESCHADLGAQLCAAIDAASRAAPERLGRAVVLTAALASELSSPAWRAYAKSVVRAHADASLVLVALADDEAVLRLVPVTGVASGDMSGSPLDVPPSAGVLMGVADAMKAPGGAASACLLLRLNLLVNALSLGVGVLHHDVSQMPVVVLTPPLASLYGDSDVEAIPDAFDDTSAFGYDHVVDDEKMGFTRFCHGSRTGSRLLGFAYFRATDEALSLARRVRAIAFREAFKEDALEADVLQRAGVGARRALNAYAPWPGTRRISAAAALAFNAMLYLPSVGQYVSPGASFRAASLFTFATSAFLYRERHVFGELREASPPGGMRAPAAVVFRHGSDMNGSGFASLVDALVGNDGGGPITAAGAFAAAVEEWRHAGAASQLGCASSDRQEFLGGIPAFFNGVTTYSWAGTPGMAFRAGGVLATPWGEGKWGIVRGSSDCAFAMFAGAVHVLTFHSGGIFVSRRCADGEEVLGRPEIVV